MSEEIPRIVRIGDWITFPLEQKEQIDVVWKVRKQTFSRSYFVARCWYGVLSKVRPSEPGKNKELQSDPALEKNPSFSQFVPIGETPMFIASEYIDPVYAHSPHMRHLHFLDKAHGEKDELEDEGPTNSQPKAATWGLFKIDGNYHYGQNSSSSPSFRWIVYHPSPIFGEPARAMYQHRFWDQNNRLALLRAGALLAGSAFSSVLSNDALGDVISSGIVNVACSGLGDRLKRFGTIGQDIGDTGNAFQSNYNPRVVEDNARALATREHRQNQVATIPGSVLPFVNAKGNSTNGAQKVNPNTALYAGALDAASESRNRTPTKSSKLKQQTLGEDGIGSQISFVGRAAKRVVTPMKTRQGTPENVLDRNNRSNLSKPPALGGEHPNLQTNMHQKSLRPSSVTTAGKT